MASKSQEKHDRDYSRQNLTEIPHEALKDRHLDAINLSYNCLTNFGALSFLQWNYLTKLFIRDIGLTAFPINILVLSNLELLHIANNHIELPNGISRLEKLKNLQACYCELKDLPSDFGSLHNLEKLDISHNCFKTFPEQSLCCKKLTFLDMGHNQLVALPRDIKSLEHLETLRAQNNNLACLPGTIGKLRHLIEINCSRNELKDLPDEICNLSKLRRLYISFNKIEHLPDKFHLLQIKDLGIDGDRQDTHKGKIERRQLRDPLIARCNSAPDITNRLLKRDKETTTKKDRQSIFILGEAFAGKSSYIRSSLKGRANPTDEGDRTEFANQHTKLITLPSGREVVLMYTDFGGHPVYQYAYRLFLSMIGICILMFNAETYGVDFQRHVGRWLHKIKNTLPNAIVFLVGSHSDKVSPEKRNTVEAHVKRHTLRFKEGSPLNVNDKIHFISSTDFTGIDELDNAVLDTIEKRQSLSKKPRGDRWFYVDHLLKVDFSGRLYVTLDEVKKMYSRKIGWQKWLFKGLGDLLEQLQSWGAIVYFPYHQSPLKDYVFPSHYTLVSVLALVVNHDMNTKLSKIADSEIYKGSKLTTEMWKKEVKDLREMGILSTKLLRCLLDVGGYKDVQEDVVFEILKEIRAASQCTENSLYLPYFITKTKDENFNEFWNIIPRPNELQLTVEFHFLSEVPDLFILLAKCYIQKHEHAFSRDRRMDWVTGLLTKVSDMTVMIEKKATQEDECQSIFELSVRRRINGRQTGKDLMAMWKFTRQAVEYFTTCQEEHCDIFLVCPGCILNQRRDLEKIKKHKWDNLPCDLSNVSSTFPCCQDLPNTVVPACVFYPELLDPDTSEEYEMHRELLEEFLPGLKRHSSLASTVSERSQSSTYQTNITVNQIGGNNKVETRPSFQVGDLTSEYEDDAFLTSQPGEVSAPKCIMSASQLGEASASQDKTPTSLQGGESTSQQRGATSLDEKLDPSVCMTDLKL
ncbi:uncharacterized protein LOC106151250 [Lingula anatina]|uniref:Uncharacterized protein LOC106151250 n=1 Tax=Lingula anatina TaxID=7574 RepID=A0A1S3H1G7_LINAN|nr:uncharacterized protein LOC106151250 [Lingula anatina]|eukprot:XP_013379853.1 uncharacterized protein LOC106151250 [Lingula anatina]